MLEAPALWPDTTTTTNGKLQIGGCDVTELAATYGTPLYLLDEATLRTTASTFQAALQRSYPAPAAVHYASKALLNLAVAQLVASCGLGLDCVSLGEFALAQHAGIDPGTIHLHGNAKPRHELAAALAAGVGRVMIDSLNELEILGDLTADRAASPRGPQLVLLRLNPGIDVHTHAHIQTGQLDSKFGLPIATGMAEAAVRRCLELPGLQLTGLHIHLGSQIAELQPLAMAIRVVWEFAATMRARYGWTMTEFSPGGGLAVPYVPEDPAPNIDAYIRELVTATLAQATQTGIPLPRLVIEPGRALIARAVVALYCVVTTKHIPGVRTFVAVDGGMGDNIRPALYDARYHAIRADQPDDAHTERVTIVGRYCESGDVLLRNVLMPALSPGALVGVPMAGAYTLSMASNYNMVPRPALVLLRAGQSYVIQRRETLDDLMLRDLPLPPSDPNAHTIPQ